MRRRAPPALKVKVAPVAAPVEEERFGPVPCVHGYFPDIPFRHPPPLGLAYKPPTQPRKRVYIRDRSVEIDEESLEGEAPDAAPDAVSDTPSEEPSDEGA